MPTFNYSTQSTRNLRHFSYHETDFCVPLSVQVAAQSINESCTTPFVCFHSRDSDGLRISWGGETSDDYLVQGGDYI